MTVWVADQDGRTAYQHYELRVTAATANQPPQVDGAMRRAILAGRPFPYQVRASDPDDDPLSYTLGAVPGGSLPAGLTLDAQGLLFWQPTLAQVNDPATPYEFTVTVGDGPGGHAVLQPYRLDVVAAAPANAPPQITSTPRLAALPGEVYTYPAAGYDPDGDTLLWQVAEAGDWSNSGRIGPVPLPPGLTVDPSSGHLLWVPTAADVGAHEWSSRLPTCSGPRPGRLHDHGRRGQSAAADHLAGPDLGHGGSHVCLSGCRP